MLEYDKRIDLRIKSFELAKHQFAELDDILKASEIIYDYLAENDSIVKEVI
jgi:hypothetical protein